MNTLLIILGALAVFLYFWYISIVTKRNKAQESLSGIDVQLRQRSDLIPNILQIAKRFMEHEASLLNEITALRTEVAKSYDKNNKAEVREHLTTASQLSDKMGSLMIAVENYPDLKSNDTMVQAMQTYNEVEAQISASRRFYNASVTSLNNSIQIFPGNLIARSIGITPFPFFETDSSVHNPIDAAKYLG